MTLTSGTKLGPYEIDSLLGAGGMGEVYRARDTRLGRDVALKILPESFAGDSDRLRRFEQETRAVAALNHPNILAIYDVGHHNGSPYLVCELLEGASLREMLDGGALAQRKTIDYGVQVAQGLAAAHEKGIVHRDLKPENLFISRDGRAKILDFGLAKLAQAPVEAEGATMTHLRTSAGVVMGTASYMAPEQVRGDAVDGRTDIFALGAVLSEMLTGKRAFHRDTAAETMTAVLKDDLPEPSGTQPAIAPALDRIVRRCVEKSPEQRFQSAKDLSFALGVLSGSEQTSATRVAEAGSGATKRWMWAAMAFALLAAGAALAWLFSRPEAARVRMEFSIPVPGEVSQPALSLDGKQLVYVSPDDKTGIPMLFVQRVGTPAAAEIAGTEGASYPFWSPDDAEIGFFAHDKLQKVEVSGGSPRTLAKASYPRGASWGAKNVILFAPDVGGPIWRVDADGSHAEPVTSKLMAVGQSSHRWPLFLPDGEHYLFLRAEFGTEEEVRTSAIYMGSLSGKDLKLLIHVRSNPGYADGHLLYVDEKKSLIAVPLDVSKGTIAGDGRVIVETVGYQPAVYRGAFTAAEDGTVIYNRSSMGAQSILTWIDRAAQEQGKVGQTSVQANPAISPDGDRVAVDITDLRENNLDIWIEDLKKGTSTRFTFDPAEETDGVWSPDGSSIAYRSNAGGLDVKLKKAHGLEPERMLLKAGADAKVFGAADAFDLIPNSWTPDGQQLLCSMQTTQQESQGSELVLVPVSGGTPTRFLASHSAKSNGQISADGKWVAFASDESGDWEIYVTTFPGAAGKWQISRGGGTEPRWRHDGKEIFYLGPTGVLMAVPVDAGETFSSGTPAELFQVRGRAPISSTDLFTYDVSRDGQRFLVNQYVKPAYVSPLTIVQHSFADPPR